jgi:hypothetical protein
MVLWTICPGWSQTTIILISASRVARISDVSHWVPSCFFFWSAGIEPRTLDMLGKKHPTTELHHQHSI